MKQLAVSKALQLSISRVYAAYALLPVTFTLDGWASQCMPMLQLW